MGRRWTLDEIKYLRENYNKKMIKDIEKYLNRSVSSISKKAKSIGLSKVLPLKNGELKRVRNNLGEKEINYILDNYLKLDRSEIAKTLGMTELQIYGIARYRGLKINDTPYEKYSDEEIKIIKDNWANRDINNIMSLLPNRTIRGIIAKASHLGLLCDKTLTNTAIDGEILDSGEERQLYEFIKFELQLNIESIGLRRVIKFHNDELNESYYPDFIIKGLTDRPIIIEYYGMITRKEYKEKAIRKNNYYKSLSEYYFLDIYPKDLRYKFKGVNEKLTPFLNQRNNQIVK